MGNCAEAVAVAKLLRLNSTPIEESTAYNIGDVNFVFVKRGDYRPGNIIKKLRRGFSKNQDSDSYTHGDIDVNATGIPRPITPSIHHPAGFVGL